MAPRRPSDSDWRYLDWMALAKSVERRRNLKALGIAATVLVVVGLFAYRPATVMGIDGDALAHSIRGSDLLDASRCREAAEGHWRCVLPDAQYSGSVEYVVDARSFGCWDAVRRGPDGEGHAPRRASGCINIIDVLSPL